MSRNYYNLTSTFHNTPCLTTITTPTNSQASKVISPQVCGTLDKYQNDVLNHAHLGGAYNSNSGNLSSESNRGDQFGSNTDSYGSEQRSNDLGSTGAGQERFGGSGGARDEFSTQGGQGGGLGSGRDEFSSGTTGQSGLGNSEFGREGQIDHGTATGDSYGSTGQSGLGSTGAGSNDYASGDNYGSGNTTGSKPSAGDKIIG